MAQIPLKSIKFPGLPDTYTIDGGLSEEAKAALLACFQHVAWIDEHGQDHYDDLYDALYPATGLVRITATFTQGSAVINEGDDLNTLKQYLVVTGYYSDGVSQVITDYALSGQLTEGTSTITVTKEGKTATFTVIVSAEWGSDYTWLYNPAEGVLFSARTDIVTSTKDNGITETLNNNLLNLSGSHNSSVARFRPLTTTNNNAKLKAKFRINYLNSCRQIGDYYGFRLQLSNGTAGAHFYTNKYNDVYRLITFAGQEAVVLTTLEVATWYTVEVILQSGKAIIYLNGEKIYESTTLSTLWCTSNQIAYEAYTSGQEPLTIDVDVAWITYKNND